ncbi:U11/U12 small nuclear ribonucleoprotein 48 kDa protein [Solanum pennellii]|uniref:U11/U12 small nuclear ribonucleoprotein 48 kDa protein n=1 Tax=Solanum pennellii TaxID=28526 RepID=A0ABM1GPX4_SOLPN|nr:U11/U12 small nuclear ribonucleoprotein 48 kDa protein [Solanum pennellii]XP_015074220.1 U11/U12 small nuclear ribonucleoprotein 48 kDa protein [Solanum pennellii]XP_015074221.1 U11/U12 small nuclear ribonucleoprotein 48 kDa protein [Solanum pennellii]XP_015074222.1 U11/U12 small nuclear ribonucleoprotein 48 kDa protein [Solanum pennellii]XP_015074223.1 U11/U12 small nuclear ribonucleoprotein 48 kDa protein [Solanum pennellii]XP_015074224.1 U11/U12 small nuclear ribonucleoprotein 48 kDa pro
MNPFPPPPPLPLPPSSAFPLPPASTFPRPPPSYFHHPTPTSALAYDLPSALSSLTSLLNLSSTTLNSLSSLLPIPLVAPSPSPALIPCPFNSNHRLPLSSLFSHSLHCPPISSSSADYIQTLIQHLKYPHTLHYSNPFTLPLLESQSDLCFSLETYLDFENPTFCYSNCPGVVSFPIRGENANPPMLTLPAFLSSECANFGQNLMGFPKEIVSQLLPSEVYAIRNETDHWNEFPFMYSYHVLRAILGLGMSSVECLSTWVVANSARYYSVVLDLAMRDHVLVLFKLCLKAIVRESIDLASTFCNGEAEESVLSNRSFKCPVLVQVLVWLGTQLSVLYGEMNGKLFAINMLKQRICDCAFSSCMFNESTDMKSGEDNLQEPQESGEPLKRRMENGTNVSGETLSKSAIFVSQVAAAVAALYERSMFEEKLKALRSLPSLPAYQRSMEHTYISNKADEERQKRPNYKPLLEHDGLLWQHSRNNQDTDRKKTRAELLAEERDYKRRRMSYRGKKLKRSTTQVMRDIIEEYMEEIRQADPINCPTKGAEVTKFPPSASYRVDNNNYKNKAESGKRQPDSSALSKEREGGYREDFHTDGEVNSTDYKYDYSENMEKASQWHHRHSVAQRSNGRSRQDKKDYSRSPNQRVGRAYSREKSISKEKRDYSNDSSLNFSRSSSRRYHKSNEESSPHRERGDRHFDFKKRKARDASDDFEDRYDPSGP